MYYYDNYGWLTSQPNPTRSTSEVPPAETATHKANWTGLAWVLVQYTAPPAPTPPAADPCLWLIDHGPLLDRFGTAIKMRFLKSTDPDVAALRQDFYGRKWLDLKNPELKGGFYFMAGVTVPVLGTVSTPITGLTSTLVDTVFATPVEPKDNLALRKLYF